MNWPLEWSLAVFCFFYSWRLKQFFNGLKRKKVCLDGEQDDGGCNGFDASG